MGRACRTPKWVSLVMKLMEFNLSKSPDHRKTAPPVKTYSKDIPNSKAEKVCSVLQKY
jgi:hypothetical protein